MQMRHWYTSLMQMVRQVPQCPRAALISGLHLTVCKSAPKSDPYRALSGSDGVGRVATHSGVVVLHQLGHRRSVALRTGILFAG